MTIKKQTKQDQHLKDIQDAILSAMNEHGTNWIKPWAAKLAEGTPYNVASKKGYKGFNPFWLSHHASKKGYSSLEWGTFKQWTDKGGSLKGAKGAGVPVFYWSRKEYKDANDLDGNGNPKVKQYLLFKNYIVFNRDVVQGLKDNPAAKPKEKTEPVKARFDAKAANKYLDNTGAVINYGGDSAHYTPVSDKIQLPNASDFKGTATSTPEEAFYSTALHELVHWTGAKHRLNRDLSGRFGNEEYAFEELIAETGAILLSIELGISPAPRADHAQYLNGWKKAVRSDAKAIYSAFGKATKAVEYLDNLQTSTAVAA
jgi:antirestriction protein ArdC